VSHETHSDEPAPITLAEDLEPTVLSYREFRRRQDLLAWYRRRREYELTGAVHPSAPPAPRRIGTPA
jgi:hypothetical protein